ncbi:alpha/beta fold hydrolase [Actinoplanes sp. NPDC051343]|uniref:alpha/beta fold hydrolase n=1 Tax=Actinoplanes sp. NPDC051343 TaxID=3363906 RepID=UPI0037A24347
MSPTSAAQRKFFQAYDTLLARWPIPVESVDVRSAYGMTRVQMCGRADGPALVLLCQFGATSTVWFANVGDLGREYRIYAVDPIGQPGRSVAGNRPITDVSDLMDWLDGVLSELGLESVSLCGHSYGAWLSLNYAMHAPQRVRRLALLDPTDCFAGLRLDYRLRAVPLLLRPSPARWQRFVDWETHGAIAPDPQWSRLAGLSNARPGRVRFVAPHHPDPQRLQALRVPTLLVMAERSRAHNLARVEANARRLLTDVTITVQPAVAHQSMPTAEPDVLNGELLAFLH